MRLGKEGEGVWKKWKKQDTEINEECLEKDRSGRLFTDSVGGRVGIQRDLQHLVPCCQRQPEAGGVERYREYWNDRRTAPWRGEYRAEGTRHGQGCGGEFADTRSE